MPKASYGFDELAFEQLNQFIASAGPKQVLAQLYEWEFRTHDQPMYTRVVRFVIN
jgi:hypothetical protein